MSDNWSKAMIACYHPSRDWIDMGMGIVKCYWCAELHDTRNAGWPRTTAPRRFK